MQPYFFPYLGYFAIMKYVDWWIVLDEVQFIRHGWIERNRILKPVEGWQYISVPLEKHSRDVLIKKIKIRQNEDWDNRILRQLEHYKKNAPYYPDTIEFLRDVLSYDTDSIAQLNVFLLKKTCSLLGINVKVSLFSEMDLEIEQPEKSGDWALNISRALNATEYVNPPGGASLFDRELFQDSSIGLKFLELELIKYNQGRRLFEPGLSIVDVLMFNKPEEVFLMLDNYRFT